MTKSSVSRAVDSLVRQGYIHTREDDSDRRITHLVLEEKASPVIELGVQAQQEMLCFLCQGISEAVLENLLPHPHPASGKCPGSHEGLWNKK